MKKSILALLILCISANFTMAQTATVKGAVVDTTTQEDLTHASVCLLQAKDSFLYKFARVQSDGSFSINNVDTGKYILMVSYPEYADFVEKMSIDGENNDVRVGKINMIQTAHLLQDVIVTQKIAAIRIKGDTTEFKADSFKVQPNASVEDLLKQLPGIQVDKDGKITAQGQTVKHVLVDGEEFFGDDPTLVTKNLRADMIDKVQLYDKSSDQSAFTGIDDGNKEKTINVTLKANKKAGYFGKASGGLGTDKYYQGQGMFNYFKGKKKFAAYGTFGNTGTIGLGFEDEMKYAGSNNVSVGGDGSINISYSGGNDALSGGWDGNYNGQGIPDVQSGGVHFDNKWDNDKQSVNFNYKIGGMSVLGNSNSTTQNNLNDGVLYTNSASNFSNHLFRQKADGSYQVQIDSSSSIKVVLGGSIAHTNSDNFYTNNSNRTLDTLVNSGMRATTNTGDNKNFSGNILWQKKFKKKGRTLSWNLNEYATNSNSTGYLNSETDFYNNNSVDSTARVNQFKTNDSRKNNFSSNITYTEPLNKNLNLLLSYNFNKNNSNSNLHSYNKGADSMYSEIDSVYSNHYLYDQTSNGGGLQFNFNNKKKINFNIGTNISSVNYKQSNLFASPNQTISRNFINWNPNANLRLKIKDQESLNIYYYGYTQQPSISQLQPVLVNNDPLNVYVGNPNLKPSFSNGLQFNFNSYKILSQKSIYFYGSYSFTSNPIVANVSTDKAGVNTYNYFNLKTATSNYYLSGGYNAKIKPWDLQYGFGPRLSGNKYVNFTNDIMNVTKSNSYGINARFRKYKEKKYDISLSGNVGYNTNNTTLQNQINNNAWSYSLDPSIDIFLPAKFQLHTDGDYSEQQGTQSFAARSQFIWNAWIGKKFFKKENLLLKASVNDILDQNNGFSRSANNNTISQSYYTTIRRYFMLSLVWDFSKMGPGEKK